jgi:PAS domain S-box-containing protein
MYPRSGFRVLLVDDDAAFADVTAEFLERVDDRFSTEIATSANEGLERLAASDFDCIISDYEMPGHNGIDFLESVRERAPDLPFILFTGKGSEEIASDAISAGVTDYLQKAGGTDQYAVLANRVRNAIQRYRAEQARDRQRNAIETAQEGIAILNQDAEFVYVNRAYEDLYGYDRDELVGDHWGLTYPDAEVAFARNEILPTVAEEGYWHGETTGLRADGTTFPEYHTVTKADTGELICSVQDCSEEKQRQTDLIQFRTLVETLDDPVYVLDETGQFEYINDAFVEMVGYDRETVIGANPALIKSGEAVGRAETNLGRILSSGGPDSLRFEVEIQAAGGESIPCEDHMSVLPYEGDQFEGSVGILRDITERKRREKELQRQNERLEEFASVVSHDLRNPLQVADGRVELLREECDSDHIDDVAQALDRMDTLIEDLLTLAREGDRVGELESVVLADLVETCWQNIAASEAEIVTACDRTVQADRNRLKQLVENLLRNAVEHGSDDVTITVGELDEGFYFEDNGSGISQETGDDVFEAGYSTSEEGTGFGLSIVKQVAEAHGWTVGVAEGADGGARFEITGVEFSTE